MPDSMFEYDYWLAFDDKGVELIPNGLGGGSSTELDFNVQMSYVKMNHVPKSLTIIPAKISSSGGDGTTTWEGKKAQKISKTIDGVYPIELPQGKVGKLIIQDIKSENNQTTVTFNAEGIAPYTQGESLYIEDEQGEMIEVIVNKMIKDEQKPNEFTMVFEALEANKKYRIVTYDFGQMEIREDLKFTIDLR
ncbi:hypothetical protein J2S08_000760 [Bacillus chungangensis]|uniref:Uncharacterized protein n=1 Tax=Bacillus chungangensis TaxID=587633 RepID=A0ABT9WNS8_9BACI|nr:hypothetical protein [Bacillus chungangensis]